MDSLLPIAGYSDGFDVMLSLYKLIKYEAKSHTRKINRYPPLDLTSATGFVVCVFIKPRSHSFSGGGIFLYRSVILFYV